MQLILTMSNEFQNILSRLFISLKVIQNYVDFHFTFPKITFANVYSFPFFEHNEYRSLRLTRLLWLHYRYSQNIGYDTGMSPETEKYNIKLRIMD